MGNVKEFTPEDQQLIRTITQKLTGSNAKSQPKIESSLVNIRRRMEATRTQTLAHYLAHLEESPEELAHFISAITIHTTSWFREAPHFDRLRHIVTPMTAQVKEGRSLAAFRVLSAGCSTGEEGYSLALVLEELRQKFPGFDYHVEGWDVDPISIRKANQAVYNIVALNEIPHHFHQFLLAGSGPTKGLLTLSRDIRNRCQFRRRSLLPQANAKPMPASQGAYDIIFCRNVLIYFGNEGIQQIITNLLKRLKPNGHLCLGHSESIDFAAFGLINLGNATYKKLEGKLEAKVEKALHSSKPPPAVKSFSKLAAQKEVLELPKKQQVLKRPDIIVVGASTGGTEALIKLLHDMPQPCPPLLVVQHIAPSFAKQFASRLAQCSGLTLATPTHGSGLQANHLYMAWDDYHIGIYRRGGMYYLEISRSSFIHGVRPSVDYMFQSLSKAAHNLTIAAVLLTGMGKDGALGLSKLYAKGAMTFSQDQESSAVFGMPREAILLGAAGFVGSPAAIRQQLLQALAKMPIGQAG